jgi:hypothetical protein
MSNYKPTLTDEQKDSILQAQFDRAMNGDSILLVHLGKTELAQQEVTKHILEAVPLTELSYEELLKKLDEQRLLTDDSVVATVPKNPLVVEEEIREIVVEKKTKKGSSKKINRTNDQTALDALQQDLDDLLTKGTP